MVETVFNLLKVVVAMNVQKFSYLSHTLESHLQTNCVAWCCGSCCLTWTLSLVETGIDQSELSICELTNHSSVCDCFSVVVAPGVAARVSSHVEHLLVENATRVSMLSQVQVRS